MYKFTKICARRYIKWHSLFSDTCSYLLSFKKNKLRFQFWYLTIVNILLYSFHMQILAYLLLTGRGLLRFSLGKFVVTSRIIDLHKYNIKMPRQVYTEGIQTHLLWYDWQHLLLKIRQFKFDSDWADWKSQRDISVSLTGKKYRVPGRQGRCLWPVSAASALMLAMLCLTASLNLQPHVTCSFIKGPHRTYSQLKSPESLPWTA